MCCDGDDRSVVDDQDRYETWFVRALRMCETKRSEHQIKNVVEVYGREERVRRRSVEGALRRGGRVESDQAANQQRRTNVGTARDLGARQQDARRRRNPAQDLIAR